MIKPFKKGSLLRLLIGAACTLFFAFMAVVEPNRKYIYLVFVMIGLSGTWREYLAFRRCREPWR